MQTRSTPLLLLATVLLAASCHNGVEVPAERLTHFSPAGSLMLPGGETAAEISAYDERTRRLFVVNATKAAIDIVDLTDPFALTLAGEISIAPYGAGVNSVSVSNGLLAAAIESDPKTDPGKVVVWNTDDLSLRAIVAVGALPDMVTFSPDGRYLVAANEGEPSEDYTIDPVGSVSVIEVNQGFGVRTLDFSAFASAAESLRQGGLRTPGPPAISFAQDIEPEYVAISHDSRYAWVTLQENNAVARINLAQKAIEAVLPLGFKDHAAPGNEIDASDRDNTVSFLSYPVRGMFLPDGISVIRAMGRSLFITANEGDSRLRPTSDDALPPLEEGELFNEESRLRDVILDPMRFPDAAAFTSTARAGRLKITNQMGDIDGDGDFDELYSFGTRSFSIFDGTTGALVYESGNLLEKFLIAERPALYDDGRSDDKGAEPESVVVATIGPRSVAFIGLERADAVVVVDVTSPAAPRFLQVLDTGDAPEGLLFIPGHESPTRKPLLVASCEGDGSLHVYQLGASESDRIWE